MRDDEQRVAAGYDAVYAALPQSATFARIWREHALAADYPAGFEHISFLTLGEMRLMADALRLGAGATLLDLGCGMGGPGLWLAREAGARLIGIDLSTVALGHARARAENNGLAEVVDYRQGSFAESGLNASSADAAMSVDAWQYAPDKRAAFAEAARVLRPGGRLVIACFEFDESRVRGLPIFGTDPVSDYAPLLEAAGFAIDRYDETPGWRERVTAAYQGCIDARAVLAAEMGEPAANALLSEMMLTLQVQPYRRRVLFAATKR